MTKPHILFVDDETHVLRGLGRLLVEWEEQWEVSFATSGAAALDHLAEQPADVVVSDMRMPGMDGAELLNTVRRLYPATIRVILSGYAETDSVLKTVGPAHFYFAKPCDPTMLFEAIARPLALRRLLAAPDLQKVVGEVSNLPSLPELFSKIHEEVCSETGSPASVAALLSQDLAMTAEVLKLTNSAFFGLGRRVTSALQAVRTLGMDTIQALVLQVGLFRQFSGGAELQPVLAELNRYSLMLGNLAAEVARAAGEDDAIVRAAHCAGMLSAIGSLVLLDREPGRWLDGLAAADPGAGLSEAERKAFGATHHLVGAYLLGLWGFTDTLVEAVAFAAEPSLAPGPGNAVLTAVHVATALGPRFPGLPPHMAEAVKLDMAYLIEARQDGKVRLWRDLVATHLGGETHG